MLDLTDKTRSPSLSTPKVGALVSTVNLGGYKLSAEKKKRGQSWGTQDFKVVDRSVSPYGKNLHAHLFQWERSG